MKLWLLLRDDVDWDEYGGHVVRAETEESARAMCEHGEEGREAWTNPARSTCVEIAVDGPAEHILGSFNAG